MPGWVPDKLPLLKGTYAYRHLRDREGRKRVMLYVPDTTTQKFGRFVTREWANAGYALGPGDAEQTEIELFFTDLPAQGFAKANDVACDPGYVILYLTYAPRGFSAANRPHFRRSPSPSP
jgi:hypothetical protein